MLYSNICLATHYSTLCVVYVFLLFALCLEYHDPSINEPSVRKPTTSWSYMKAGSCGANVLTQYAPPAAWPKQPRESEQEAREHKKRVVTCTCYTDFRHPQITGQEIQHLDQQAMRDQWKSFVIAKYITETTGRQFCGNGKKLLQQESLESSSHKSKRDGSRARLWAWFRRWDSLRVLTPPFHIFVRSPRANKGDVCVSV